MSCRKCKRKTHSKKSIWEMESQKTNIHKYQSWSRMKAKLIRVLIEYKDCFAWDYDEIPGLNRSVVEHRLPIQPGKRPVKRHTRRFALEITVKIKQEIERLLKSRFIRTAMYVEWLANIVHVIKKNGTLRISIDFRDLNNATLKDEYSILVVEMLVN